MFAQRVSPELAETFKAMMRGVPAGHDEVAALRAANARLELEAAQLQDRLGRVAVADGSQVDALLADVERLTEEVEALKQEVADVASGATGAAEQYWKARAMKAEQQARKLEEMYG